MAEEGQGKGRSMAEAGEKKEDGRGKTRVRVGAGARAGHCQGRRRSWEGAGEARVWLEKEQGKSRVRAGQALGGGGAGAW